MPSYIFLFIIIIIACRLDLLAVIWKIYFLLVCFNTFEKNRCLTLICLYYSATDPIGMWYKDFALLDTSFLIRWISISQISVFIFRFGWFWSCGFGKDDVMVKSLQRWRQPQKTDKLNEKNTLALNIHKTYSYRALKSSIIIDICWRYSYSMSFH